MKTLLFLLAFVALPTSAQDLKMDAGKSQLSFAIWQMNVPIEGGFKRFPARGALDPARPEAGRFRIEVDINSIDTGSDEGDSEARRPVRFDSARYPRRRSSRKACARKRTAAIPPWAT